MGRPVYVVCKGSHRYADIPRDYEDRRLILATALVELSTHYAPEASRCPRYEPLDGERLTVAARRSLAGSRHMRRNQHDCQCVGARYLPWSPRARGAARAVFVR